MRFEVAIPSYRRAETLRDKTLAMLAEGGISPKVIRVFVADDEEYRAYKGVLPKGAYREIVVARPTLRGARNFIQDYYDEGSLVVNIDDDVRELKQRLNSKKVETVKALAPAFELGFTHCGTVGCHLWGLYPLVNPLFMRAAASVDIRYIIGACWGVVNTHDPGTYVTMEDKEDFERTILFYKLDGAVVRLNHVGIVTNYYDEPGGMQVTRTEDRVRESALALARRFPLFCTLRTEKKSGHWELRLRDKTKKAG